MSVALDEDSRKVVRVLLQVSALSGGELANLAGLAPEKLYSAVQALLSNGLISVNQPLFDASQTLTTYFNLNPSARHFAEFAAR